ncbi:MAG: DUF86 domain-containing protein [Firmicutes bacterium]|nr:DUF86 domain-containing protein [Bacillota bacterium]
MIRIELIDDRIDQIRSSVHRLEGLSLLQLDEFISDPDNFAIAEHHLRRALESLLDIGRHILAKGGFGKPVDYADIITSLGANGVIPMDFANGIRGMAGYRNRLVHVYAEITPEEIYSLLTTKSNDFHKFCEYIEAYMMRSR